MQVIVLFVLTALAAAAPQYGSTVFIQSTPRPQIVRSGLAQDDPAHAVILRYDSDNIGIDRYSYK